MLLLPAHKTSEDQVAQDEKKEFRDALANKNETSEKDDFLRDRAITIMALDDKCPVGGAAAKLKEDGFNNPVDVDMCEEVGEKTFRPGTKMREDVFMTRYTQDQRKNECEEGGQVQPQEQQDGDLLPDL